MSAGVKTATKPRLAGPQPPSSGRSGGPQALPSEDKLLWALIGASLVVHLFVMIFDWSGWRRAPIQLEEQEESIAADLVTDFDKPTSPIESTMPKAKQADEAKVSDRMLPQLPQRFTIKETPQAEPLPAEPVPDAKPTPAVEPVKPAPEEPPPPKVEAVKPPTPEPPKQVETLPLPKPVEDEANKVSADEARKRAALEKLKELGKTAKQAEAPKEDPMVALKNAYEAAKKSNSGPGSRGTGRRANNYALKLKAAIQPNYNVPEVYRMRSTDLVVSVLIAVNDQGQLGELSVDKSSGVSEFDEITIQAIRASVPLPKPPPELSGQQIIVNFNP